MATKTRLPNKTLWALDDILDDCESARKAWRVAMGRADKLMDPIMLAALAKLRDAIAEIERKSRDARAGKYDEGLNGDQRAQA